MHFGYSLYADHKEEHVIVKMNDSNKGCWPAICVSNDH